MKKKYSSDKYSLNQLISFFENLDDSPNISKVHSTINDPNPKVACLSKIVLAFALLNAGKVKESYSFFFTAMKFTKFQSSYELEHYCQLLNRSKHYQPLIEILYHWSFSLCLDIKLIPENLPKILEHFIWAGALDTREMRVHYMYDSFFMDKWRKSIKAVSDKVLEIIAANKKYHSKEPFQNNKKKKRVAIVTSNLIDNTYAPTKIIRGFTRYNPEDIELFLLSTEIFMERKKKESVFSYFDPSSKENAPVFIKECEELGIEYKLFDFNKMNLVENIIDSYLWLKEKDLDLIVYHSSPICSADSVLASLKPAKYQVNFNHGVYIHCNGIDAITFLNEPNFKTKKKYLKPLKIEAHLFVPGLDLALLKNEVSPGIECLKLDPIHNTVLVCAGFNIDKSISDLCAETYGRLLKENPNAALVLFGPGKFEKQIKIWKGMGVLQSVRLAGAVNNFPACVQLGDIYLNEFPTGGYTVVLESMAAGLPVVASKWGKDHVMCCGAGLIEPYNVQDADVEAYYDEANKLIRDLDYRKEKGLIMNKIMEEKYNIKNNIPKFYQTFLNKK